MEWLAGVLRWAQGQPAVDWTTYDFGLVRDINAAAHMAARTNLRERMIAALEKIIATAPDVDVRDTYVELPRDRFGDYGTHRADAQAVYDALVAENPALQNAISVHGEVDPYIRIRW